MSNPLALQIAGKTAVFHDLVFYIYADGYGRIVNWQKLLEFELSNFHLM